MVEVSKTLCTSSIQKLETYIIVLTSVLRGEDLVGEVSLEIHNNMARRNENLARGSSKSLNVEMYSITGRTGHLRAYDFVRFRLENCFSG
jgi:hypothetical protein